MQELEAATWDRRKDSLTIGSFRVYLEIQTLEQKSDIKARLPRDCLSIKARNMDRGTDWRVDMKHLE